MAEELKNPQTAEPEPKEPEKTPTIDDLSAQIKQLQTQLEKTKKAMDNAASDASKWKDKWRATVDEATAAEEARKEAEAEKDRRIAELERKEVYGSYLSRALALGYDADLAAQAAEAGANGDIGAVFDTIAPLIQAVKTKTVTENYGKQPHLSTGTPPSTNTLAIDEENKYRKWAGLPPRK